MAAERVVKVIGTAGGNDKNTTDDRLISLLQWLKIVNSFFLIKNKCI